jgi:hypothetical protein
MRLKGIFLIGVVSTFSALSQAAVYQYEFQRYYSPTPASPLSDGSPTFTLVQPATVVNQAWAEPALNWKYAQFLNNSATGPFNQPRTISGVISGESSGAVVTGTIGTLNNSVVIQSEGGSASPEAPMPTGEVVLSSDTGAPSLVGASSNGWSYAGLSSGMGFVVEGGEVPEPSTLLYCLLGMLPTLLWARRRQACSR